MPAKTPFDATAQGYDLEFSETAVGRLQRARTHAWLQAQLAKNPATRVLELNCGTGEDAKWLASLGLTVTATDLSGEMVSVTQQKTMHLSVQAEQAGILDVAEKLSGQQFDLIWSNFGGYNCLSAEEVWRSGGELAKLLKPGGTLVTVVMGRFCAWETLYFLTKFKFRQAFRRMKKGPVQARLNDDTYQPTWYFGPGEFSHLISHSFAETDRVAIGAFLPPSYLDPFFAKRPKLLARMLKWENRWGNKRFAAQFSDHFLVAFRKK